MGRKLLVRWEIVCRNAQGLWVLRSYNKEGQSTGAVLCSTSDEAYRAYIDLNGLNGMSSEEILDYQESA